MKKVIHSLAIIGVIICSALYLNQQRCLAKQTQNQEQITVQQQTPEKKVRRVYIDMVGDLFHVGHINAIKNARQFGDYLIVGVCGDEECTSYKRRPIETLEERVEAIKACRYVDEVIPNAPVSVTKELIEKYKIDVVVHGDDFDEAKMRKYYGVAMDLGILQIVPYTKGISTSDIIRRILSRAEELAGPKKGDEKIIESFKLVKDKIPDIMKNEGKNPKIHIADESQFYTLIKNKLQEEVSEFLADDSSEELCDILEVIHAICENKKTTMQELEQIRLKKLDERGAFTKRFVLELQNK